MFPFPTQLATLEAIAQLCPAEGGRAVYWAIGLYGHLTRELLEIQDCPLEYRSGADREKNTSVFQGSLNIFPNPSSGPATLQYHVPGMDKGEAIVFDGFGRSVVTIKLQQEAGQLPLPDLAPGVYLIRLSASGQHLSTVKFIQF